MKDFALEPGTKNFLWKKRGMTMTSEHLQYMQQKVICCLSIFKGEWYLDTRLGLPYIPAWDIDKDGHRSILESAVRIKISGIVGIKKLLSFSSELDLKNRSFMVSFSAQCDNGEVLEMNGIPLGGKE
ncbi:MAG: hypothetical protein J5747_00490 [Spirochaetaceae bacterium]|nr:hypothetical protein [Spirochaetaceae bacterium]